MCIEKNIFDENIYSKLLQVYLLMNVPAKVDAMAAALRSRGVKVTSDHFLSLWTGFSTLGQDVPRALQRVFADSTIEVTAGALCLMLKYAPIHPK